MSDKKFPTKYSKKLDMFAEGYSTNVDQSNTEEIKKLILTSERNIYEIEEAKENNDKLTQMKEDLKDATAPYSEAKTTETAKIKYCLFTLEGRGVKI